MAAGVAVRLWRKLLCRLIALSWTCPDRGGGRLWAKIVTWNPVITPPCVSTDFLLWAAVETSRMYEIPKLGREHECRQQVTYTTTPRTPLLGPPRQKAGGDSSTACGTKSVPPHSVSGSREREVPRKSVVGATLVSIKVLTRRVISPCLPNRRAISP